MIHRFVSAVCLMVIVGSAPQAVFATVPSGCVGPVETGESNVVGWIDVGIMLGGEQAKAPELLIAVAPDGTTKTYFKGDGLTPPTDVMPIWFAPAHQSGDYTITVDGDVCTVTVTASSISSVALSESENPLVATAYQSENGTERPIGALALISVGLMGLILFTRRWRRVQRPSAWWDGVRVHDERVH